MEKIISRIESAILRYKENNLTDEDFQITIESISDLITENDLYELREKLREVVYEFERIKFMVEEKERKEKYLKHVSSLENFLHKKIS